MLRHVIGVIALCSLWFAAPASALTAKECSVKYQAAQKAGTLNGQKWNEFRKAQCSAEAAPTAAPATAGPMAGAPPPPSVPASSATRQPAPVTKTAVKPATAPAAGEAPGAFPTAIAAKYANESAGLARRHTCLDQYNANKAANATGGLKWIEKGGGYYAQCNARLKP